MKKNTTQAYQTAKDRARKRSLWVTRVGQDIGPIPPVKDIERRMKGEKSFRFFCETYFPQLFRLAWSDDHLRVIRKIESVVVFHNTFAVAMPRGSGKTSLSLAAVIWAVLTGRHAFVYLLASSDDQAVKLLGNIKGQLSANPLLLEDYPESIYPIQRLENEARRCTGQKCLGAPTHIKWGVNEIVLPTIPNSKSSGAVVRACGLAGNFRGAMVVRPNGQSIRPTLVVADDPQNDASARSMVQTAERLSILNGTIIGLAGPDQKTGVIVPCTVIQRGDLADQILDHKRFPAWRGERTKMIYQWPKNADLWAEYCRLREQSIRDNGRGQEATEFYRKHKAEMDEGAVVAWPARFSPEAGEISALQAVYNLLLDYKEQGFAAEFQNEPLVESAEDEARLTAKDIWGKANGRPRGHVPPQCTKLTAFIDVHDNLLFYAVCGWEDNFTGYVVDYGTFPKQNRRHFTLTNATHTLGKMFPEAGRDGAILAGLESLVKTLLDTHYQRGQGYMQIDRLLVDMGYKDKIVAAVKYRIGGSVMMLSKGVGIRAGNRPISQYQRRVGWKLGYHWYIPNVARTQEHPHMVIDTNFWKSFIHDRFSTAPGDAASLTLFGSPETHELFAAHIAESETWVMTHGQGRDVKEWRLKPSKPDNHWFDCLVGCAAAASEQGIALEGQQIMSSRQKKRLKISELQAKKRNVV